MKAWVPGLVLVGLVGVCQGQMAMSTKLVMCAGMPCIEAKLNGGRVLTLALDTGEPTPILDAGVAKSLGLALIAVPGKDGKPSGFSTTKIATVESGGIKLTDVGFAVVDLSDALQKGQMPKVDGTLAYGAFEGMVAKMDFAASTFSVEPSGMGACAAGTLPMSLINFGSYGPPVVTATGSAWTGRP